MKQNSSMKRTKKLALSAILSSMGVLMLYLGSVIEIFDLTMAAFASIIIILSVIEMGGIYPWLIYGVTSLLSLVLLPNKFIGVLYLVFAGLYPILKEKFERLHPIVSWILKLSMFNTALIIAITTTKYLLHIPDTEIDFKLVVFLVGNATFILYDLAITRMITIYLVKIRSRLKLKNYFEN